MAMTLGASASAAEAPTATAPAVAASINVSISNLRSTKGDVLVCLSTNPKYFPDCRKDDKARKIKVAAADALARLQIGTAIRPVASTLQRVELGVVDVKVAAVVEHDLSSQLEKFRQTVRRHSCFSVSRRRCRARSTAVAAVGCVTVVVVAQ